MCKILIVLVLLFLAAYPVDARDGCGDVRNPLCVPFGAAEEGTGGIGRGSGR
jgi:hypothetical protein